MYTNKRSKKSELVERLRKKKKFCLENSLAPNRKNSTTKFHSNRTHRWQVVNGWRKKERREPFSVLFNCATAGSRSARSYAANIDHDDVSVHSRARPLPQHFHAPNFVPAPCPFSVIRLIMSKNNLIQLDFLKIKINSLIGQLTAHRIGNVFVSRTS